MPPTKGHMLATGLALVALGSCLDTSRPCGQVDDEARALRITLSACDPGDPESCVLERMSGGRCLTPFRCTVALNRDWRQLDRHGQLESLERDRRACGGTCDYVLCGSDQDRKAVCNPTSRLCEMVQNTDAGGS